MSLLQALILGLIQGVAEFLPISSSGHLILIPFFFDWPMQPLYFDVALHWATLLAVVGYFAKDWIKIIKSVINTLLHFSKKPFAEYPQDTKLGFLLIIGSIPAGIVGFILQKTIEDKLRSPYIVVFTLIIVALLMWWVETKPRIVKELKNLKPIDSVLIGFAQALALIPGTSRSGITIVAGMLKGLSREAAARFSFLLSVPAVFGAGLYEIYQLYQSGFSSVHWSSLAVGFITALATGFLAIRLLMNFLKKQKMTVFVVYRLVLAVLILVLLLVRK